MCVCGGGGGGGGTILRRFYSKRKDNLIKVKLQFKVVGFELSISSSLLCYKKMAYFSYFEY